MQDLCVFAVNRGAIKKRFDTNYNLPKNTFFENKLRTRFGDSVKSLGEIADVICGPFGSAIKNTDYQETGIPLVRITNISKEGYMNYDDLIYISEELGNSLNRTQVSSGDIVISQRGSLGQCAIIDDTYEKLNISANIIAIKNIKECSATFIRDYLHSNLAKKLIERNTSGQVQQKLTTQDISDILIPVGCDEKLLTNIMSNAYYSYKEKLKEAITLLEGITKFVLEQVDLFLQTSKQPLAYAIPFTEIKGRIDADFYSQKFANLRKQIDNSKYDVVTIGEISEKIVTGFAAGKQDQADDLPDRLRVPHLRPFNITKAGELSFETKKYVPKDALRNTDYCIKNELIFNNTNSSDLVGKTTVFEENVLCATSNHMTRITVKHDINPQYISAFFNVLREIGYWKLLCTNFNNQAGINIDTLKEVRIPLPEKSVQDRIAKEIINRRGKSNSLRQEAEQEWQSAKEEFEKALLGE